MKGILLWLLKLFLKGIGVDMGEREIKQVEQQRNAAIAQAETAREAAEIEKEILRAQVEAEAKERARPKDLSDPFAVESWNRGD